MLVGFFLKGLQLASYLDDKFARAFLLTKPPRQLTLEFRKQRIKNLDQDVWKRMLLEVFAIQVNWADFLRQVLGREVQEQCLAAAATTKYRVVLSRRNVAQAVGHVDVGNGLGAASLDSEIFVYRKS